MKTRFMPKLENPCLVAGLPDMGGVAGIAMTHLVKQLSGELFAEIVPYWPPSVGHSKGVISFERQTFQFHRLSDLNVVTFSGPFQPNLPHRLYELCYKVADVARQLKIKRIYTLGAAYRGSLAGSKVYGVASKNELVEELTSKNIDILEGEGEITGFNGLMLGIAMESKIEAVCLLSEIDDPEVVQPLSAAKAIEAVASYLNA
ncbi:MAG: PAC2 family protein, partial [Candidatus Bathyarchaeia archaeon]